MKIFNAKSIFNVLVYSALLWSILSAVYVALPIEYQAMLPFMNEGTAIVGGITTALGGTGGLAVVYYMDKNKKNNQEINSSLVDLVLARENKDKIVEEKIDKLQSTLNTNNKLLKIDLKAKLDNPTLTDTSRQAIEGVIYEDNEK